MSGTTLNGFFDSIAQPQSDVQSFLESHRQKSLKPPRSLELFEFYLRVFQALELLPVPLKENRNGKLIPAVPWGEVQSVEDVKKAVDDLRKIRGFAVKTGSPSKAVVLDVDDEEKFSKWAREVLGLEFEEFKRLADWTVKTKSGGWHFWFRTDEATAKRFKTTQKQDLGFDLRGENGLCNLVAWDRGDGQLYQFAGFSNAREEEKTAFLRDLYHVLYAVKEEVPKVEKEEAQTELGKALREAYERGELDGWTIEAGLSALLVKWGYSDEQIHEAFKEVYGAEYDQRRTQYIVQRTREKDYGINREFLDYLRAKGLLKKRMDKDDWEEWRVTENRIFRYSSTGRVIARVDRIDVLARIDVGDRPLLRVRFRGEEYLIPADGSRAELMRALKTSLSSKEYETYMTYINYVLGSGQVPREKLYTSLGWDTDDWVFKHPLLIGTEKFLPKGHHLEGLLREVKKLQRDRKWEERKEKFFQFLAEQVREGTLFSALYACGLASLFVDVLPWGIPFTVIVVGDSGAGKTTACQMVQNAFLPPEVKTTTHATQNSLELAIATVSNMPILFDELSLAKVDAEDLVFMVGSGRGKTRASADLSYKVKSLRSVVFLTTEVAPEFQRRGAIRRVLSVLVERKEDLFGVPASKLPTDLRITWGHGIDFAKALVEDKDLIYDLEDKALAWLEERKADFVGFEHIAIACLASTFLLEEVLKESAEAVREKLYELIQEQVKSFVQKGNVYEELVEWTIRHSNNFYGEEVVRGFNEKDPDKRVVKEVPPKGEVWGRFAKDKVYYLPSTLKEFARQCGKDYRLVLRELAEKGVLELNERGEKLHVKSIGGRSAKVYVVKFENKAEEKTEERAEKTKTEVKAEKKKEATDKVLAEFLRQLGATEEEVNKVLEKARRIEGLSCKVKGEKLFLYVNGELVGLYGDDGLDEDGKTLVRQNLTSAVERLAEETTEEEDEIPF